LRERLVGDGLEDVGRGQLAEAVAEDGFRQADVAVKVVEAAHVVDGVTQDPRASRVDSLRTRAGAGKPRVRINPDQRAASRQRH
jgi:hypothetical protein